MDASDPQSTVWIRLPGAQDQRRVPTTDARALVTAE
jgi:hypothetical protein